MSWQDRYTQNLRITTGDAEVFEVFTRPSFIKEIDFHTTEYSFIQVDGDLIKRRRQKGRSFPLEFFFIGENCIEDAKSFEFSAAHPDPWRIEHPYYDNILVQVSQIKFDDTELNVTKVTCTARETVTDNGVLVTRSDPRDVVLLKKVELDDLMSKEADISPSISETDIVLQTAGQNYQEGVKIISLPQDAEDYFNAYNEAITNINNITASPILAIQALNNFLSMPAQFEATVKDRIRSLGNQIDILRRRLKGLFSVPSKQMYQAQHVSLLSAMCEAAVNPTTGDYTNASLALEIAGDIKWRHAQFLADMDGIQSDDGGNPEHFIPDFNFLRLLNDLVLITVADLFEIALAGRKEFSYVLPYDSNVILLTHRFYKLDKDDNNIQELIDTNNLTYKEIALGLPKGKTIVYYK